MPLTNFYNFYGCTVPTISSCRLKDYQNVDRSGGITLNGQNIKFLARTNVLGYQYWTDPAWISGKTFTLKCTDLNGNAYESNSFLIKHW